MIKAITRIPLEPDNKIIRQYGAASLKKIGRAGSHFQFSLHTTFNEVSKTLVSSEFRMYSDYNSNIRHGRCLGE
jgi:hypothetical protein